MDRFLVERNKKNECDKECNSDNNSCGNHEFDNSDFLLDGVLESKIQNYNEYVLSKRKMWRIPENELKMYIIKNKLLEHQCKICSQAPKWRNKPLELVLDRINNEILDNDIDNLRFLCPNCYSQVKKKSSIFEKNISAKMIKCEKCNKRIKYKTFSINKNAKNKGVEALCKLCLDQERIETKLNKSAKY